MSDAPIPSDPARWGTLRGYLEALGLVAAMTLLGAGLFTRGAIADIGLLYLVPVMFAATRHGLVTGIVTGLGSSLAYNFFFIPPIHTFAIRNPAHLVTVLVLLGVAVVGSQMAGRLREQARLAQANSARDAALAGFARQLMAVSHRDALWPLLAREIARRFDVRVVMAEPDEDGQAVLVASDPPQDRLDMLEQVSAQWCLGSGLAAGPGAPTPTASEWLFHPVAAGGKIVAVVGIARPDAAAPLRAERLPLLGSLLDQASLAAARIMAEEEMVALGKVQERDRLRAALLSSVGHDLRTPLTTVLGTLRAMRAEGPEQAAQLAAALAEAERLERFVANLLDMVRIETGNLDHATEPVDLGEAVAAAIGDVSRTLAGRGVDVEVPDDLPLVLADPRLLHHCLINLIDNAARHGGADGRIVVRAGPVDAGGIELSVIDEGPGLPPGAGERLFGMFQRLAGSDRTGGSGLGLAIVRGFAEAMGFSVSAANRADGRGACFALHVPSTLLRDVGEAA
ncbi:DUF4118 domain-containing protein [Novosphingobium sp. KCTC 2891]|uniref:DUF4118 domain-containing protein n=1 Tax=Novosphingobium sp. KCTC 2891 TaxID=2989730 RepID=UPI002221BC67|nr:DUF4118 domain-containing protein [Novosphingobium sp. KCTC 2891]MCW1381582.1 DUF4118 domain-containing protein [Novosphingobium sp. KCTC 2891]